LPLDLWHTCADLRRAEVWPGRAAKP
jgi:hypothetical protein